MKTILSISLICFFIPALSQKVNLKGYAVYVFDDKIDSYYDPGNYYDGKIKGGLLWGLGLEYMASASYGVELSYLMQSTTAPTTYLLAGQAGGIKTTDFDLNLDWIMLGGNRYVRKPGSKLEGFGGLMIGAAILNLHNPENGNNNNDTKFAWGLKLGANIWASPKVAIKLQTQLMSAVQGVGGGLYFGTGGAGAGVTSYSTMTQFGLGGGLCIALGGNKARPQ